VPGEWRGNEPGGGIAGQPQPLDPMIYVLSGFSAKVPTPNL
jgi:hypothetical protein